MRALEELRRLVERTRIPACEVIPRTARIGEALLGASPCLQQPNFEAFREKDLELLFDRYDREFFGGLCRASLGTRPLDFRISPRMTRAGGTTARFRSRVPPDETRFEIAVSSILIFQTFEPGDLERQILVNGRECKNRLEALQRIMEHEMVHLAELLIWDDSKCSQKRFQSIAGRLFAHTDHRHRLVTSREIAAKRFGVAAGGRVRFRFDGRELVGIVNRITRRATVLVEDPNGAPYSDGRRYNTFYVPLPQLEPLTPP